ASDELSGRSTGSPEGERAAAHLAEVFAKCGLEPAGDAGTFLQAVPLHTTEAKAAPELRFSGSTGAAFAAALGRDFEAPSVPVDVRDLELVVAKSAAEVPKEADPKKAIFVDAFVMDAKRWL